jgi:hypothetical protein
MMKKVERKLTELNMPPYTICRMCRNNMVDVCVEDCAPKGDCRHFDLKDGVNLQDMSRFPLEEFLNQMPPKVRQVVAAVYLAKVVDFLQGVEKPVDYLLRRRIPKIFVIDPDIEKPAPSPNGAKNSHPDTD